MKRSIPAMTTTSRGNRFVSAAASPPATYEQWREAWRTKNRIRSADYRKRGYKRVAAWISPAAAQALAAAQQRYDTSISDEIEQALILNFQVRVQGATP